MKYFRKSDENGQQVPTSSFSFNLKKNKDIIARRRHQFEPFIQDLFKISEDTLKGDHFNGTVFRFPLRNSPQSRLSSTQYDVNKIKSLVHSLHADAHHILLFLRNIESIGVYEKKTPTDKNPKQLVQIRIAPDCLIMVRKMRQDLQTNIREKTSDWMNSESVKSTYPMTTEVDICDGNEKSSSVSHWIVTQYHAGKEEATEFRAEKELRYLPIVGTAIEMKKIDQELCLMEPEGHLFCFLPLPREEKSPTGLRFHVHGCFAIEQNRRHMKWPMADQAGELRDPALLWNQFLVNIVLPKAMKELTTFVIKIQQEDSDVKQMINASDEYLARIVYAVLPETSTITPQWKTSSMVFTEEVVKKCRLFYSPVNNRWLHWEDAIFDCIESKDQLNQLLRSVLDEDCRNLVCIPSYILNLLPHSATRITAENVATSLKNVQDTMMSKLSQGDKETLLQYLINKLNSLKDLIGLRLLPLADGNWTTFEPRSLQNVKRVFFGYEDHSQSLLPGLDEKFVNVKSLRMKCEELAGTLHEYVDDVLFCFV
jgi:sacsin